MLLPWFQGPSAEAVETAEWVLAARQGASWAFERLYRRHLPLVHGILLGRCRAARAEELAQECFALAFAQLTQLREAHKFAGWVAQIARRLAAAERIAPEQGAEWDALPDPAQSPEHAAESARVLQALRRLPEAYRETLILRLVEGLSGPEIAALTGLRPGSVRVNLHRGMARLRAQLGLAQTEHDDEA